MSFFEQIADNIRYPKIKGKPSKSIIGKERNENIEYFMLKMSKALESLIAEQKKELRRLWYPININVDIPNGTTVFTIVQDKKDFQFSYLIEAIGVRSETNTLARILLEINGRKIPELSFLVDGSNNYTVDVNQTYYCDNDKEYVYPFKQFVSRPFELKVFGVNTHSASQFVYITLYGYMIGLNETGLYKKNELIRQI